MEGLNLEQLLTGDVNRLRYIERYSTAFTLHKENVAEHSFYVTLYALFIAKWAENTKGMFIDYPQLLGRAVLHDLDEVRTGDFPRPFKYRRPVLRELLDQAAREEFEELAADLLPGDTQSVGELLFQWETSKDLRCIEGVIVSIADFMAVLSFLISESVIGNPSVAFHSGTMMEYANSLQREEYDDLRELVEWLQQRTKEAFGGKV